MSNIDEEALEWAMRQAGGELGAQERAAFDAWYGANPRHQGAYLRALAIQHSLDQITVQDSLKPRAAQRALEQDAVPGHAGRSRRTFMFGGALAAGLAALSVATLRPDKMNRTVLQTALGEFRKVPLADRSVVSMNSGTELEVALSAKERRIVLTRGEAWFEVAKDKTKPFIVESGDTRVRAVGTAFAVRHGVDGAEVLVTEGVVEVWSAAGTAPRTRMAAGTRTFLARRASTIDVSEDPAEIERRLAWRSGKLVFHNRALADAVADFNRYNSRQIVIADPSLARRTLVGQYALNQPELFANDVRALFRVPVSVSQDRITIGAVEPADRASARR